MSSLPGVAIHDALRALCTALQARLEAVAENAIAARLHLASLYTTAKDSIVSEAAGLDDARLGLIDVHFAEVSADIDRAEAQKTARLEAELVTADEALAAAMITDLERPEAVLDSTSMHAFEPVELETLRVDSYRCPTMSPDGVRIWFVCAPPGLRVGDVCLHVIDRFDAPTLDFPMLQLVISDAYESRGPHENELALQAAAAVLKSHANLESKDGRGEALPPSELCEEHMVDPLRNRIVLSHRIPAGAASSDTTIVVTDVTFRGKSLQIAGGEAFPRRFPILPPDVNVLWETHYLQFGPWRVARNTSSPRATRERSEESMTIWNGASPGSDAWVVVELVHLSNGWFRFQRGADKFVHWGGTGIEPADAGDDDVFDPWNTPLRPALVSARSFESTLRSPESCMGGVRFLGMGQSASGPTFSLCLYRWSVLYISSRRHSPLRECGAERGRRGAVEIGWRSMGLT